MVDSKGKVDRDKDKDMDMVGVMRMIRTEIEQKVAKGNGDGDDTHNLLVEDSVDRSDTYSENLLMICFYI
ncbi:hypothetical protein [Caldalkalibacillus mannanilyticus]|uniref:hypothetical protein n=1 Tax=Caldalkalibacillus mannanilyticus TaxID=1418 RepID=UPI0004681ABE|nr:hypothetical protein [Caldalkalibacillus mannanilyticus]